MPMDVPTPVSEVQFATTPFCVWVIFMNPETITGLEKNLFSELKSDDLPLGQILGLS